jgi:hypothetical protein
MNKERLASIFKQMRAMMEFSVSKNGCGFCKRTLMRTTDGIINTTCAPECAGLELERLIALAMVECGL